MKKNKTKKKNPQPNKYFGFFKKKNGKIVAKEKEEDFYGVGPKIVASVESALENNDKIHVRKIVEGLSEYEIADMLEKIATSSRMKFIEILGDSFSPDVFPELNDAVQEQIIDNLDEKQILHIANELTSDQVVEMLEYLDDDEQQSIIRQLDPELKYQVKSSLAYPDDSAGRIMVREFVSMPDDWSVSEAKKYLLKNDEDLPEEFYTIFLTDDKFRPTGEITLDKLLRSKAGVKLIDIMDGEVSPVDVYTDQEEVAHMFREYGWIAATVVDKKGRLVGVINFDDIVQIIHEEATEDAMLLSGADENDLYRGVFDIFKSRAIWLITNLFATIVASSVVDGFTDIIAQVATVAVLMPIVASMGGTTGNQTLAVIVRAIATKELNNSNVWKMVAKEFMVGLCNGTLFAILVGITTYLRFPEYMSLAFVIGIAMFCNLAIASLAGVLIPIILHKFKADPAISSGVFLIAITDSGGFFIFLTLASLILT